MTDFRTGDPVDVYTGWLKQSSRRMVRGKIVANSYSTGIRVRFDEPQVDMKREISINRTWLHEPTTAVGQAEPLQLMVFKYLASKNSSERKLALSDLSGLGFFHASEEDSARILASYLSTCSFCHAGKKRFRDAVGISLRNPNHPNALIFEDLSVGDTFWLHDVVRDTVKLFAVTFWNERNSSLTVLQLNDGSKSSNVGQLPFLSHELGLGPDPQGNWSSFRYSTRESSCGDRQR